MKHFYSFLFFIVVIPLYAISINNIDTSYFQIPGLKIFPNPASSSVNIYSDKNLNKEVIIFDVLGKEILKKNMYNGTLDISNIKAGVYLIKITETTQTISRKLVIK